ncbi:MAG: hypothetical protein SVV80_09695 [Planctomycetota bacterium]|nr:hypothetical protein [Planctomycetota bacterium]
MNTSAGYEKMDSIIARLESVRRRFGRVQIAHCAAGAVVVVCGSLVIAGLAGYWPGQPPAALRWALLSAVAATWAAGLGWLAIRLIRRRLNYSQAARMVEESTGGLDNALINAVQLSDDPQQVSGPLVQSVIGETASRTAEVPFVSAVDTLAMKRWGISAAVAAGVLCVFALLQGPRLSRGVSAVFGPTGYVREIPKVKLISMEPGDATRFVGEQLTITAKIENPQRRRYETQAAFYCNGTENGKIIMLPSADRSTYTCAFGKLEQSVQYAVWIGDSKFPTDKPFYAVTVIQHVEVEGMDLAYAFPQYTGRKADTVTNAAGPIKATLGTMVKVTLRLKRSSSAALTALLRKRSGESTPMRAGSDGKAFSATLRVTDDDAYRIVISGGAGQVIQQLPENGGDEPEAEGIANGYYDIRAIPDSPPKIAFVKPNSDMAVGPGGKLATLLKVSDDFGLENVRFFMGGEDQTPLPMVRDFAQARGKTSAELEYAINIGDEYRQGDVIVYYAGATDGRRLGNLGGPQTAATPKFKIIVRDAAKVAAERARRYEMLRARLMKILAAQETQRVNTEIVATKFTSAGREILVGQQAIRADMLNIVEKFPFEPEMITIRQALALLANNEAAEAVTQARVLADLPTGQAGPDARDRAGLVVACRTLTATQNRIIHSLQMLLAILPSLANPDAAEKTAAGDNLPPEAREKLAKLKSDLKKFIDEQTKIIQASDRLAKKPVDNFTTEDEKLLKELVTAQDKWEKFLNEAFADFSKLAQQDFSNPSLLAELLSIKSDVTMARDALTKQAAEIATAIEDNGIENAKTLTANIEKWLPDEPDRIKWNMEDPAGQENIEQAELPKELEDLVGDLLEEEEDLFEEMDDVTGKYTMSGDKGIGWDAMDGPISSMNAQGVTGNRLPNTSEIAGRSGEGRTGKSTGEYVEDKAVGKGGRRTPTRLTPEPFQKGQVSDSSGEPGGGATGGGKLSGAGSEGLEGPLPPPVKQQLKRLAGKHAQLLSRAQRLQAAFKVTDYSNFQFLHAVTLMNRLQGDLDNFRYRNALRRRGVTLSALKQTRQLLTGQIDVTTDSTAEMPKKIRDDISDAMKSKLPAEYSEILQKYFRTLSEQGK